MNKVYKSPRLSVNPWGILHKDGFEHPCSYSSCIFGLILFLEYGSFEFSEDVKSKFDNNAFFISLYCNEDYKTIKEEYNGMEIKNIKILKCFGSKQEDWDPNFLLFLYIENQEGYDFYNLKVLQKFGSNELNKKIIFSRDINSNFDDDLYNIPIYLNVYEAAKKANEKKLFEIIVLKKIEKVNCTKKIKKQKGKEESNVNNKKINLKDLEIKTSFTFLKGIKYEI